MRKFYFILAAILLVGSVKANVITGNFSICLPGPNTTQLSASLPPAPITATTPWVSLNPGVATISSSGLVTAVSFGVTTITYTDNIGNLYSENVYVSTFPTITADNGTATCQAGTLQLSGSLFPNALTPWTSLTPAIATVDSSGLVTGVSAGIATIQYMNLGGCTTTIPITINPLLSPTVTCGATTPSSITFNWNAVFGSSNYSRLYSINGGAFISGGSGSLLSYTINGLLPGDLVSIYVAPSGAVGSCYQAGTASCSTAACPNAGIDGTTTICETSTSSIVLSSLITGEVSGGTWTRTSGTGGTFNASAGTFTPGIGATTSTFTYTIVGTSPCPNDTSVATIIINQQPNAGIDGAIIICDSSTATIDLFSLITGEQLGGTWTRVTGTGGVFSALSGTYTPSSGATTSAFTYNILGTAPCINDASTATVNINTQPNNVILSGNQSVCVGLSTTFIASLAGGSWSSSNNAIATVNSVTGEITGVSAGVATITYTVAGSAPCINANFSRNVTISELVQPTIGGFQGVCVGSFTAFSASPTGGVWSSSNNTIASVDSSGFIIGNAVGTATISYTLSGSVGCATGTVTRTVTVSAEPTLQLVSSAGTAVQSVCVNSSITPILYSASNVTASDVIVLGLPAGILGSFNAGTCTISGTTSEIGTYQYTVLASGPCGGVSLSGTLVILPNSDLLLISEPFTSAQVVCLNSPIDLIEYYAFNGATGASVVGLPQGITGTFDSGICTISGTAVQEGTFPYTVTTVGGCGVVSLSGIITSSAQVSANLFCDAGQATAINSVFIDWNELANATNYEFTYSINEGPVVNGSTTISNYEIFDVSPGQNVLFTLTNAEGVTCFQSSSWNCSTLASESFDSIDFQSFPNPVKDILNITSLQPIRNIQIANVLGQEVFSKDFNEKDLQINLSHLSSGTYIVKAMVADSVRTFKIVKN